MMAVEVAGDRYLTADTVSQDERLCSMFFFFFGVPAKPFDTRPRP